MTQNALVLANSSLVGSSAVQTPATQWQGGRTALTLSAKVYASGAIYLQALMGDGVTLINVAGPYGANQITTYDLPRGYYQIVNGQSTSIGVYAVLANVPYT